MAHISELLFALPAEEQSHKQIMEASKEWRTEAQKLAAPFVTGEDFPQNFPIHTIDGRWLEIRKLTMCFVFGGLAVILSGAHPSRTPQEILALDD